MSELKNRIDFVYIFDVQDGNPNGDPDAGNLPRVDAETGMGLVTDVCLKRKVRNYIQVAKELAKGYDIFIKEKAVLNTLIDAAHDEDEVKVAKDKTSAAREVMCKKFFDIRTFGAVMSTGKNAGQVRGPIQFTFARSKDPIATAEHSTEEVGTEFFHALTLIIIVFLPLTLFELEIDDGFVDIRYFLDNTRTSTIR
jgi:CRISPR-associated protein Csd2